MGSPPVRLLVENLSKNYQLKQGKVKEAVQSVSFSVAPGTCYGLLGPNGAGKSTTINCITGFFPPTTGKVIVEGHDVHLEPKAARMKLGVCQQEDTLDSDFNCIDQLVRHARFFRIPTAKAEQLGMKLLTDFQLGDMAKSNVDALSGGMRRKLQVARALVSQPDVLVLDEPTTGLDPEARRSLWDVLVKLRREGLAILMSTHYMDEAERLCDRIGMMNQGKILAEDSPEALVAKYIGTSIVEEEVRPGVIWKRPPNLEDVFLKLSGMRLSGEKNA